MSITELAEHTDASEGSVVAFCRRVGATGFQDLKILLARDLVDPVQLIHEDLKPGHTVDEVGERVFAAHAASLAETLKLMSSKSLGRAVDALRTARRIETYGIGSAAPIAEDLAYRLMQLGYASKAVTDSHIQAVSAAMTGAEVTTVTISHSGSTIETILATRLAHERGAKTIGITRLGKSPLSRHCDILLHTVANETKYRPEAMSSRVAQLAIIDTLVSCCALSSPEKSIENLQRTAKILSEKRY
jgi:RpiR family carbohydrate utilization transcriptional regulator